MTVSFDLDGDVVLYTPQSRQLYLLNPAASLIWLALDAGLSLDEIARSLAEAASIPLGTARRDCETVIEQWRDAGLRGGGGGAAGDKSSAVWWPAPRSWEPEPREEPVLQRVYRIADFCFLLRSADSEHERLAHDHIAHLECPEREPDYILELTRRSEGWELALQGRQIDRCETPEKLVPLIHRAMLISAWRGSGCPMAIHAGLLVRGACTLLIAGTSGAGKSTLTAALSARGFRLGSDDMVLLSASPMRARAVATPIRLREHSWPVLQPIWPQLSSLPVHRRRKGGGVRYLLPPDTLVEDPAAGYDPDILVFSSYSAGSKVNIEPLSRAETLLLLTEAGYDFTEVVSEELIGELIGWISGLQCYRLEYGDLDEAVAILRELADAKPGEG